MGATLRVLGPVELDADGGPVALGGNRQRAIIAFLALHQGRPVPIDQLVEEVWGEGAPTNVVKSLSTLLSRLRMILEPSGHVVQHDGIGYCLTVPDGGLDLLTFRDAAVRSRVAEVSDDVVNAIAHLERGLGAWSGPALDRLDAPFVARAVDGLEIERQAAVDSLVRLCLRVGDHARAIGLLEDLVAVAPYREDRWAALVLAHRAAGAEDRAIAVHDHAVALLQTDLGLLPGEPLVAVRRAIDGAPHPDPDQTVRGEVHRIVGRDAELARMEANAAAASEGGHRVQLILGEAGSGKSHLVRALVGRLGARGLPVLIGRCDPMKATPLGPLLEAIAAAVHLGVVPEVPVAEFPAVAAALAGQPWMDASAAANDIDAGDLHRRRILTEVAELAQLAGRNHPLIVAVEDLQWADPYTLSVLHHLGQLEATATTCFIATARTPEFHTSQAASVIAALASSSIIDTIELTPLSGSAVRELVAGTLPSSACTPKVLAEVERGSGGNPLYALHLAHHIAERGADAALDGDLPADSLELFTARLRSITPRAAELIAVGATLGLEFSADHLNHVFRESPLKLMGRVSDARLAGLIEPVPAPGRYRFVHGLVRRAAYESLDRQRRGELHVIAAKLLGHGTGAASLEIAEHLWRARAAVPADEAAEAIVAAVRPTIGFGAFDAAEELLVHGLAVVDASPALRAEMQVLLGEVLLATNHAEEGQKYLTEGRELAEAVGRWDVFADAVLAMQRVGVAPSIGQAVATDRLVGRALLQPALDRVRRIELLAYRTDLLVNVDAARAGAALEEARLLLEAEPSPPLGRRLDWLELRQLQASGHDPADAVQRGLALLARSEAADDRVAAALAASAVQSARVRAGLFRDVVRDSPRFLELAADSARADLAFDLRRTRAASTMATEPIPVADAESERLAAEGVAAGIAAAPLTRVLHLWVFRREQLRLHELQGPLEYAEAASKRVGNVAWLTALLLEQGDVAGARQLQTGLLDALVARPHDWARVATLALMADIDADIGRTDDAERLYAHLLPAAGQVAALAGAAQVLGRVDRYLGRLARLRGDLDGAVRHFTVARELDQASGAGLWVAWAAHDEAAARLVRGTPEDLTAAMGLLASAATTAKRYGSRRLGHAIRRTRREAT